MQFRWNAWNEENCTKHGCSVSEVESIIKNAGRGFPRKVGDGKYLVIGPGQGGRFVEVFYLRDPASTIYPIHAMPIYRRRRT